MTGRYLRKALVISALLVVIAVLTRALRGKPVPAFERTDPPGTPWPTLRPEATWSAEPMSEGEPAEHTAPATREDPQGPAWIEAPDGGVPGSHPVKAKLSSGIYHLPGMMNYDRTKPDRCYRTAEDAEADGLRAAKR